MAGSCGPRWSPLSGDSEGECALCAEAAAGAGGVGDAVLVALAYERTGSCAGTAPDGVVAGPEMAMGGLATSTGIDGGWEVTLVIRRRGEARRDCGRVLADGARRRADEGGAGADVEIEASEWASVVARWVERSGREQGVGSRERQVNFAREP